MEERRKAASERAEGESQSDQADGRADPPPMLRSETTDIDRAHLLHSDSMDDEVDTGTEDADEEPADPPPMPDYPRQMVRGLTKQEMSGRL